MNRRNKKTLVRKHSLTPHRASQGPDFELWSGEDPGNAKHNIIVVTVFQRSSGSRTIVFNNCLLLKTCLYYDLTEQGLQAKQKREGK